MTLKAIPSVFTGIALAAVLASAGAAPLSAASVRFEFSASAWSLRPFTTPIEDETENVIEREILRFLKPVLEYVTLPPIRENLTLDSSGGCWSAAVWVPVSDRLELGVRGGAARLRVPFILSVEQSYEILGYDLVKIRGDADGRVRFTTVLVGLLGRWTVLRRGRLAWSFSAGATALPFKGDVEGRYVLTAETPLGPVAKSGDDRITIEELREVYEDIPAVLIAPWVSTACAVRLSGRLELVLEAGLSQGSFLSAGLSVGI